MKLCCHVVTLQYVMLHILFLWKLNRKMDEVKQNNHIIELYPLKGKGKKLNLIDPSNLMDRNKKE